MQEYYPDWQQLQRFPKGTTAKDLGLKVGDKVVLVEATDEYLGAICILDVDDHTGCPRFFIPKLHGELFIALYRLAPLPKNNSVKTFMSSIIEKVRNLALSVEDKLLQKHGIESPTGVPTEEGIRLVQEILYKENRAKVIAEVTKIEEAEKAEKKA